MLVSTIASSGLDISYLINYSYLDNSPKPPIRQNNIQHIKINKLVETVMTKKLTTNNNYTLTSTTTLYPVHNT